MKDITILIPVKNKSTRLKNKNLKKINGLSLLEKKIKICNETKIGQIEISTNSKFIKNICKKKGIDEIRMRPNKYSSSKATVISVVLDFLRDKIKNKKPLTKYLAILPVTNPFVSKRSIIEAYKLINDNTKINSVVSITKSNIHPVLFVDLKKKIKFDKFNLLKNLNKPFNQSQDRPTTYIESAAIRITRTKFFLKYINNKDPKFSKKPYDRKNSLPIKISLKESHDINTKFDYEVAKILKYF